MAAREHVLSAGRAVLDLLEREWQPLSAGELELRLDQAVEEILESDLRARLERQPPPVPPPQPAAGATIYVQLLQSHASVPRQVSQTTTTTPSPAGEEEEAGEEVVESQEEPETVDGAAVKHISALLQSSTSRARLAGRARLSLSHSVLLSLTLLSERLSYRCVSRRFRLEKGNIHRIFFSFCERVNSLRHGLIRWPEGQEAADALFPFSSPVGSGAPQVLGVLGHARVPIRLPIGKHDVESALPEVKRMRREAHPDSWLNLELVCDRRGRFLHCRISRGSDASRGGALSDRLKRDPRLIPPGSFLIARTGYPLTAQVLTPYVRTHGPREELFNRAMEEHLGVLDRAVAGLRARFQRLRYLDIGKYERARAVVLAACVLHNALLDIGQVVEGETEKEEAAAQEGDVEEEGVRKRDAVTDFLFRNSGNT